MKDAKGSSFVHEAVEISTSGCWSHGSLPFQSEPKRVAERSRKIGEREIWWLIHFFEPRAGCWPSRLSHYPSSRQHIDLRRPHRITSSISRYSPPSGSRSDWATASVICSTPSHSSLSRLRSKSHKSGIPAAMPGSAISSSTPRARAWVP